MNIEDLRYYCLSLPYVTEDFPFDDTALVFRIAGKIFACISLDDPRWFCLKCDPDRAIELRERHSEITPAWHWNKRHWNQIDMFGSLDDDFIRDMICHSYRCVVSKLPGKVRRTIPDATAI